MNRLSPQVRIFGVGMVIVLTMLASYVVIAREHIAALDAFAYADPTLSFTASRSAAPSGSVIHLAGAPTGTAVAEFSGQGVLAYSPTFVDADGLAAVVPPIFRGGALASGALDLRLLVQRGPVWSSSAKTTFTIGPPAPANAPLGIASLFALEVTRGLLQDAEQSAAAAAAAGAPSAASEQAASLAEVRVETEALATQLEAVASGKSKTVTRAGLVIDEAGIRLMDQLMTPYFTSLGPASPSPCGDAKDAQAKSGLAAQTVVAVRAAASLFVRSIIDCDSVQVRHIAARTRAWLTAVGYTAAYALRTIPEWPKLAGLLIVTIASWGDEAVDATALWKQYYRGAELRAYIRDRDAKVVLGSGDELYITYEVQIGEGASERKTVRLSTDLAEAAAQDTYLSGQIERLRKQRAFEEAMLESILDQDEAIQARVAQGLQARQSTPTTPPPTPTPTPTATPSPTPTPAPGTAAPTTTLAVVSLPPTPSALSYTLIAPPSMTVGRAVSFAFCAPKPASATALCGSGSTNPKGGNPPYTFTYSVPRPAGLTFNSNGLVTGTPTSSGPYSFEVCVKDLSGASVCRTVGSTVGAPATAAPTAAPACAGSEYVGTWTATLNYGRIPDPASTSGGLMNSPNVSGTFTFGAPVISSSVGCYVPITAVRTNDGRTWILNKDYPYNYGIYNRLDCSAAKCDSFTFTIELTGGPKINGATRPIFNVYGVSQISSTRIAGNAGTGEATGGCCGAGTFTLTKP